MIHGRRAVRGWAGFDLNKHRKCEWLGSMLSSGRSSADIGDAVNYSVRFNSADSTMLDRLPSTTGDRQKVVVSMWVKRTALGTLQYLVGDKGNSDRIYFNSADKLFVDLESVFGGGVVLTTTQVFRDVAKFFHVYVAIDTTQATADNRVRLFINGTEVTAFDTNARASVTQNANTSYNYNNAAQGTKTYGTSWSAGVFSPFNGYIADICQVDGGTVSSAPVTSFGRTSGDTGAWVHKNPSGITWGTNGFRLQFNTGAVASDLGTDTSGNSNTFTVTNLSVTAGVGNDWLTDTPTNTYATFNPLDKGSITVANGGLDASWTSYTDHVKAMMCTPLTGIWCWEVQPTTTTANSHYTGVCTQGMLHGVQPRDNSNQWSYLMNGNKNNSTSVAYGATWVNNDIIGVVYNADTGVLTFYKNGTTQGTAFTLTTGVSYYPMHCYDDISTWACSINFGQRAMAYTYGTAKALCTANLPTPAIGATAATRANKHFDIRTRAGTGASVSVTDLPFSPDLYWGKSRSNAYYHKLVDRLRGANKPLVSNATDAETTETQGLMSFDSAGYTLGTSSDSTINNSGSGQTYVDWLWKANGTGVSNTAGSITSTVSANTLAGFSVVSATTTSGTGTIGHGLGVAPKLIIGVNRAAPNGWWTYHASRGATKYLVLNTTAAEVTGAAHWNNTEPTSTVFSQGSGAWNNGATAIFYCFAEVEGFSKIGSYVGNGSSDGPFVWCGFRPRFIMIKESTPNAHSWGMHDTARDTYNSGGHYVVADSSAAEDSPISVANNYALDINSNGFKIRNAAINSGENNASGSTYVFIAFAETPFKYSNAR